MSLPPIDLLIQNALWKELTVGVLLMVSTPLGLMYWSAIRVLRSFRCS